MAAVALALGLGLAGPIAPASALFPDRAYELVTPGSTHGHAVGPTNMSFDGTQIVTESGGGFAGTPTVAGTGNTYAHVRTAFGWTTRPLNLAPPEYAIAGQRVDVSPDFGVTLHRGLYADEAVRGQERYFMRWADGTVTPASPPLQNGRDINQPLFTEYSGGADDLSSFVFATNAAPVLPPPDAPVSGGSTKALYEVHGARTANPGLRRVDVDSSGALIDGPCGALLGGNQRSHNAISADGSRIFFTSYPDNPNAASCTTVTRGAAKVFARVNGAQTTELSQSRCTRTVPGSDPPVSDCLTLSYAVPAERTLADSVFQGASDDGGNVFFTTGQQLVNSDVDRTIDLYEYRFGVGGAPASLVRLTEGVPIGGPADGARVLGVVRVSDNGRRVAFVAQAVLTTDLNAAGLQAVDGQNNLYLYERTAAHPNGRVVFVSTLAASDSAQWSNDSGRPMFADPTGRYLVMNLQTPVTPDDADDGADAFRYDAETGELLRLSKGKNGYSKNGNQVGRPVFLSTPFYSQGDRSSVASRPTSSDGSRIVFRTEEALQPEDVNGVTDIYEWRDGEIELVTPGKSQRPLGNVVEISPDGSTIAFSAADALVPQDVDDAVGAYVARSGGGFEYEEPEVETPCEGDACQDAPSAPLAPLGLPTVGFSGSGNAVPWRDSLSVAAVSAVQRRVAARTGRVRIAVRTSSGGRITVTASARVAAAKGGRAKVRTVGSASATVPKAGARLLTLRLSQAARRQLKAGKRLAITVRVGFSKTSEPVMKRLTLTVPKGGKA